MYLNKAAEEYILADKHNNVKKTYDLLGQCYSVLGDRYADNSEYKEAKNAYIKAANSYTKADQKCLAEVQWSKANKISSCIII